MHFRLKVANENKKKKNQDTLRFKTVINRVLHKRGNDTASLVEHLKFQEKLSFAGALWINCSKLNLKN